MKSHRSISLGRRRSSAARDARRGVIEKVVFGIDAIAPEEAQVVVGHAGELVAEAALELDEVERLVHGWGSLVVRAAHDRAMAGFFDPIRGRKS